MALVETDAGVQSDANAFLERHLDACAVREYLMLGSGVQVTASPKRKAGTVMKVKLPTSTFYPGAASRAPADGS